MCTSTLKPRNEVILIVRAAACEREDESRTKLRLTHWVLTLEIAVK
jgi:hypothetical protein